LERYKPVLAVDSVPVNKKFAAPWSNVMPWLYAMRAVLVLASLHASAEGASDPISATPRMIGPSRVKIVRSIEASFLALGGAGVAGDVIRKPAPGCMWR
jgi:hypothetical protein